MHRSTILKIALLVWLGLFTSTVTTLVLRARQVPAPKPGGQTVALEGERPEVPYGRSSIASAAMNRVGAEAQGKSIRVSAAASIRDTRPGMGFVWSVRLLDADDDEDVLFEKRYDHQLFHVEPGLVFRPTFDDVVQVPLPVGTYRLEILIYWVPPNGGLAALEDRQVANRLIGPRGRALVSITE